MKKALELSPEQPYVLNYLGYSWIDQGINLDAGMKMLKRATELRPDDGAITDSVGWAYYRLGQFDKAVEWLERASEQKGDDATVVEHLGDAYWHVGRFREARFEWDRALNQKPDKDRIPVHPGQDQQRAERDQRQADSLRKGGRQEAGRLTRSLRARARQGQSLAERRRPPGRRLSPARIRWSPSPTSPTRSRPCRPTASRLPSTGRSPRRWAKKANNLVLKAARLLADRAGVAPRVALRSPSAFPWRRVSAAARPTPRRRCRR